MRTLLLVIGLALPLAARAADVPVRYTVNDTALKQAVNGTMLTFELYADAACTAPPLRTAGVAVQDVTVISRLKTFRPRGATSPNVKTAELSTTLGGVGASGNLYLKVTGVGVAAVGGACQAQAASVHAAAGVVLRLEDAIGAAIGVPADEAEFFYLPIPGGETARVRILPTGFPGGLLDSPTVFFTGADCTGQMVSNNAAPTGSFTRPGSYRAVATDLYLNPTTLGTTSVQSTGTFNRAFNQCPVTQTFVPPDICCTAFADTGDYGPFDTVDVGTFVPPFRLDWN
jgi:hypothetical protein